MNLPISPSPGFKKLETLFLLATQGCLVLSLSWVPGIQAAQAVNQLGVKQINLTITSAGAADFANMMQRATGLASDSIQRAFTADPTLSQISVKITGEHNGTEVPLLFVTVSRLDWQRTPNVQAWAQSFGSSETLLVLQPPKIPVPITVSRNWSQQLENMPGYRDD